MRDLDVTSPARVVEAKTNFYGWPLNIPKAKCEGVRSGRKCEEHRLGYCGYLTRFDWHSVNAVVILPVF